MDEKDHLKLGSLVWATFGKKSTWPATVISENWSNTGLMPRPGFVCVFWLSSLNVSQVRECRVFPFCAHFEHYVRGDLSNSMKTAIIRALSILARRVQGDAGDYSSLMEWPHASVNGYLYQAINSPEMFSPQEGEQLSESVTDFLNYEERQNDDVEMMTSSGHSMEDISTTDVSDMPPCRTGFPEAAPKTKTKHTLIKEHICEGNKDHLKLGSVVWAIFGKKATWPAIVVREDLSNTGLSHRPDFVCVFWLSSRNISQVRRCNVHPFYVNFECRTSHMSKSMRTGVERALSILAKRVQVDESNYGSLLGWAQAENGYLYQAVNSPGRFSLQKGKQLPQFVLDCLSNNHVKNDEFEMLTDTYDRREELSAMDVTDTSEIKDHLKLGSVVWATFGKNATWPALVIREDLCSAKLTARPGFTCVFWLSTLNISQIQDCHIHPLFAGFERRTRRMSKSMSTALNRALVILAKRGQIEDGNYGSLMEWALAENGYLQQTIDSPERFSPQIDEPLPDFVMDCLKDKDLKNDDIEMLTSTDDGIEEASIMDFSDIPACMGCCNAAPNKKFEHPLLEGSLCEKCKVDVEIALFATEEDSSGLLCIVCGYGGLLLECDRCRRGYCASCVKRHTGGKTLKKIVQQDPWNCFLCTEYDQATHGRLRRRVDSDIELIRFSDPNYIELEHGFKNFQEKRKIRVLSLFDGIGTAKIVLDQLGLVVDKYYASEIDSHALQVSRQLDNVEYIGDARSITIEKLKQICPIDLVLGGPPCNDLSIVNPKRKGFYGTGQLVSKFVEILLDIKILCRETNHVFFLMENSGHMPIVYRNIISMFYSSEPAVWDAAYFTGMKRRRHFWGNIPGLQCPAGQRDHLKKDKAVLADHIYSSHGRVAQVTETRTITTHTNSYTVHNGQKGSLVKMDGKDDLIWCSELERMFGFPEGYTDVSGLSESDRRKVIGKAWCVPVVCQILHPLKNCYLTQEDLQNSSQEME